MSAAASLVAFVLALAACVQGVSGEGIYDPCASQPDLAAGDGFTIGLAYYPGGSLEDWGTLTVQIRGSRQPDGRWSGVHDLPPEAGRHDLLPRVRGGGGSGSRVRLRRNIMTVVAYAGEVRSEPRIARVTSTSAVIGGGRAPGGSTGSRSSPGSTRGGCGTSSGTTSGADRAPGGPVHSRGRRPPVVRGVGDGLLVRDNCALDLTGSDVLRCQLTLATAFSGTDKHSVPLGSASQIARLGRYSVSGAANGAGAGALGSAQTALG